MKSKPGPAHAKHPPLPLMRTFEDAEAVAAATKDPFFLMAFMIQLWLGGLVQRATAEYAEKKKPRERLLQSGQAWQEFLRLLPSAASGPLDFKLACLLRFCAAENSPANLLRQAFVPLAAEHPPSSIKHPPSSIQHRASGIQNRASNIQYPAPSIQILPRWCDWVDAAVHLRVHRLWHTAPACFDADPEIRHLAALGHAQENLARLDPRAQVAWAWDFVAAANAFKNSPKWSALGQAMADDSDRLWQYTDVDNLVIGLWPLVKKYNWTYVDLLNVIRPGLERPNFYPCTCEQEFATYCRNVLGLQKRGRGRTAPNGQLKGCDIAHRLCPRLKQKSSH